MTTKKSAVKKVAPKPAVPPEPEVEFVPGPEVVAPAERVPVVGASVMYVYRDGDVYPATIAARFGTHSDLIVTMGDGAKASFDSVRYDEDKAAGTWHWPE